MGFIHLVVVTIVFLMFICDSELKIPIQPSSECRDILMTHTCLLIKEKGHCKPGACQKTCNYCVSGGLTPHHKGSAAPGCGIRNQPHNPNPLQAGEGEFPWMTRITDQSGIWVAYGALISSNWVATIAHSVQDRIPQSLKVRVGALHRVTLTALNQLAEKVPVDQIISHPKYQQLRYNVALLHLAKSVNLGGLSHIGPVCLPGQGQTFTGQRCWVTGWWREATLTSADDRSVLQKESLSIWNPNVCEVQLRKISNTPQNFVLDKSSSLCAGGEGRNVCLGGSAPLVCEGSNGHYVLVGLSSWYVGTAEDTCVRGNNPHIYSNIPNMVDFIKRNTGI